MKQSLLTAEVEHEDWQVCRANPDCPPSVVVEQDNNNGSNRQPEKSESE
ncbi:hypothetical protein [Paenibacillus arenosi]|uniref:Uncharacterized protein n=1 Tax=Paenibacillus arenosi TaxID=2774142 RepID=A0ABR9B333_9BACL|nr:hypothetical protein [Paenibacillus arenosi]MBD8499581.1 hypothetical protein [Paenibacillus arenosi]